jgi:hypothetical protein
MSSSRRVKIFLSIILGFVSSGITFAQDIDNDDGLQPLPSAVETPPVEAARRENPSQRAIPPAFAERAVTLDIVVRIVEKGSDEVWNQAEQQVTIPGRPVGIKLVGENIVVSARFTPYFNNSGKGVIVAQGQIWIEVPGKGVQYQTTVQTIPLSFGEEVYFFPLGKSSAKENIDRDSIEIMVAANPYNDTFGEPPPPDETKRPPRRK